MDLSSIYTELIMEHNKSSHNKGELENYDVRERGHNPSCGDDITLDIKVNGSIVEEVVYHGIGCAISQASASMMIDLIKGETIEEALKKVNLFINMIKREVSPEDAEDELGDAFVLSNISNMPARVKCAVLAWHTLKEGLDKYSIV